MSTTQLKIGPLPDTTPTKLTISVDPDTKKELDLYARVYESAYGEKADVTALIPSMLQTFLASDAGFKRARRALHETESK